MAKLKDIIKSIGIALLILAVLLPAISYFKSSNKLRQLKNDLLFQYYDKDKIILLMKNNLGDSFTGKLSDDFDNFVIKLVMDEMSTLENPKYKNYNQFLSPEIMRNYNESSEEKANDITGKPINETTYLLNLTGFSDGRTYRNFKKLETDFTNYPNLIIDLRDNTGGGFKDLKKILSEFIDFKVSIYQVKYNDTTEIEYSDNANNYDFDKIIILTNDKTASVSELFVSSMKSNLDNVTTIGTNTYGKNIRCSIRSLKDDSAYIFISGIMEGPDGIEINSDLGIAPDIKIGKTMSSFDDLEDNDSKNQLIKDNNTLQLEKAIYFISN